MSTLRSHRRGHNTNATTPPIERMLEALGDRAKPAGEMKWSCRCPAHDDHGSSLNVNVGKDGTVTLRCAHGCNPATVLTALGLTLADLFPSLPKPPASEGGRQ